MTVEYVYVDRLVEKTVEVEVPADIPDDELADYVKGRILMLQSQATENLAESEHGRIKAETAATAYLECANGNKGMALALYAALRKAAPNAPELSREFLEREYKAAVEKNIILDQESALLSLAPSATKPSPETEPTSAGGGIFWKIGKLLGA